ncbi:MAG: hypothetical protein JWQ16_510 [Novosphingobium sp.]|nr:hypothetical protein [Novosphingobium sp.]
MKKIATLALTAVAVLSLTACGKSDKASEGAQADNVEMPAEEAVNTADEAATPVAADTAAASDAAAAPTTTATSAANKAAENATRAAEKKM